MATQYPRRIDQATAISLAQKGERGYYRIQLLNSWSTTQQILSGGRNSFVLQKDRRTRFHTIHIPKSVWDSNDGKIADACMATFGRRKFRVSYVETDNANVDFLGRPVPSNSVSRPQVVEIPETDPDALAEAAETATKPDELPKEDFGDPTASADVQSIDPEPVAETAPAEGPTWVMRDEVPTQAPADHPKKNKGGRPRKNPLPVSE